MPGSGETAPYTYPYTGSIAVRREDGYVVSGTNRYTSVPSAHTGAGPMSQSTPGRRANVQLCDGMRPNISFHSKSTANNILERISTPLSQKIYINENGENEYEQKIHQLNGYPMLVHSARARIVDITKKPKDSQATDLTDTSFILVNHTDADPNDAGDIVEDGFVVINDDEDSDTAEAFILVPEEEEKPDVTVQ
jgi:hypothetical protein